MSKRSERRRKSERRAWGGGLAEALQRDGVWLAAIGIAAVLVFGAALGNGFVYDDHFLVEGNPLVRQLDVVGIFTTHYWEGGSDYNPSGHYRPLTVLSLAMDGLGEFGPFRFHLTNVLLHALNSLLAYAVCRGVGLGTVGAGAAGLLFAIHPVHVEVAAGITSGRSDLLAGLFLLAGLWLYLTFLRTRRVSRFALSLCAFFTGLLCKESTLTLIGLIVFADVASRHGRRPEGRWHRRLRSSVVVAWPRWAAFVGVFVVYLGVRRAAADLGFSAGGVTAMLHPLVGEPIWTRLLSAGKLFYRYIALLVYPARLSVDYSYNAIPAGKSLVEIEVLAGVALAAGCAVAWLRAYTRWPRVFLFGALFVVPYSAVSQTLILLNSMFQERYVYVPVLGLFALVGMGLESVQARRKPLVLALFALVFLGLSARTVVRIGDWRDDFTLFSSALRAYPGSAQMNMALADVFLSRGEVDRALVSYRASVDIVESPMAYNNIGNVYAEKGALDKAIEAYERAVELGPEYAEAWSNLGLTARRKGQSGLAVEAFERAADLAPGNVEAHYNLGVALETEGRTSQAVEAYRRVLELQPDRLEALLNLGNLYWGQGRTEAAASAYRQFLAGWRGAPEPAMLARYRLAQSGY
jgi:protein O-mannosyl-transferase